MINEKIFTKTCLSLWVITCIFVASLNVTGMAFASSDNSTQIEIGISEGDYFTYEVTSNSNIPTIYQIIDEPKNAESIQIQVTNADSYNSIVLNITEVFKNGTKTSWIQNRDLTSATGFPIIPANLNVGDTIWSKESQSPSVEEITSEEFPDGNRTIVYSMIPQSESGYDQIDYYFDITTGMPVEIRFVESEEVSTVFKLIESNLWTIPEFPSYFVIIFLMITVLVILTKTNLEKEVKHIKKC